MPVLKTPLKKNDLQEGKLVKVEINDKSIVLSKVNDKFYAMDSVCSHIGGPLEEGELEGNTLICPWHQGKFDIRSAKASPETDWVTDLHSYSVVVDDSTGDISVNTG
jgi:nitrite reductase/ring-hydroxylating ferredoxin subunit